MEKSLQTSNPQVRSSFMPSFSISTSPVIDFVCIEVEDGGSIFIHAFLIKEHAGHVLLQVVELLSSSVLVFLFTDMTFTTTTSRQKLELLSLNENPMGEPCL